MRPGRIALAVTPPGPNSWATALVKPMTPALEAVYAGCPSPGLRAAIDERLMTRPQPRSAIAGTVARTVWNMPDRFTWTSCCQASGDISAMRAMLFTIPALLTRMSTGPSSAAQAATAAVDGVGIGDVHGQRHRPPPEVGHRARRRDVLLRPGRARPQPVPALAVERLGVDVGDGDVGARGGEGQGDRPPDAPRRAGHEGDASGQRLGVQHGSASVGVAFTADPLRQAQRGSENRTGAGGRGCGGPSSSGGPSPWGAGRAGPTYSRGGAGGLWSTRHSAAAGAPTRLSISCTTSTTRSRSATWALTRSPTCTGVDALTDLPLTLTWPPRQAAVAIERVLNRRTAHSHWSIRVSSMSSSVATQRHAASSRSTTGRAGGRTPSGPRCQLVDERRRQRRHDRRQGGGDQRRRPVVPAEQRLQLAAPGRIGGDLPGLRRREVAVEGGDGVEDRRDRRPPVERGQQPGDDRAAAPTPRRSARRPVAGGGRRGTGGAATPRG